MMHPEFTRALTAARIDDLRATAARRPARPAAAPRPALRQRTGWWLVDLGLRLAAPASVSR